MKRILTLILLCIISLFASHPVQAKQHFNKLSELEGFEYTYVSPAFVKTLANKNKYITAEGMVQVKISYEDIDEAELISTTSRGTNPDFWRKIRDVIKQYGLTTLTTTTKGYSRIDILGSINDANEIVNLMLIVQNGGDNVSVTFVSGHMKLENLTI